MVLLQHLLVLPQVKLDDAADGKVEAFEEEQNFEEVDGSSSRQMGSDHVGC